MRKARRRLARGLWRESEYFCRIDVSALGGIVFVLSMAAFIAQMPIDRGAGPDVPRGLHARPLPNALRDDAMRIALARDGRYFFDGHQITLAELADRIRAGVRGGAEQRAYLTVDARAKYQRVALVADEIRRGGVARISFFTQ